MTPAADLPVRPLPGRCGICEGQTVQQHCDGRCPWVTCELCGGLTSYLRLNGRWQIAAIAGKT